MKSFSEDYFTFGIGNMKNLHLDSNNSIVLGGLSFNWYSDYYLAIHTSGFYENEAGPLQQPIRTRGLGIGIGKKVFQNTYLKYIFERHKVKEYDPNNFKFDGSEIDNGTIHLLSLEYLLFWDSWPRGSKDGLTFEAGVFYMSLDDNPSISQDDNYSGVFIGASFHFGKILQ